MRRRVISGDLLYPTPAEPAIPDGAVLVADDGSIAAVGSRASVLTLAGPETAHLALPGTTLMPGLINCHVHLVFNGGTDPISDVQKIDDNDVLLAGMRERARAMLRSGVTTARDLGDRDGLVARLRRESRDTADLPRMLTSGAPLTVPGGHCWFLGGELADPGSTETAVAARADSGADVIKVMVSGGSLTPGGAAMWESQFDGGQLGRIVSAAHSVQLPVAAHAHGVDSIADCVAAGVDTLEHCSWRLPSVGGAHRFEPRDDLVDAIADRGIRVCPATSRNWPRFSILDGLLDRIDWMHRHGVVLIAGTDAGITGSVFDDLHGALGLYRRAGLSPDQVLTMATSAAADAIGLGDTVGRLREGYRADLIAAHGDPLEDLGALAHLAAVVADGHVHRSPGR